MMSQKASIGINWHQTSSLHIQFGGKKSSSFAPTTIFQTHFPFHFSPFKLYLTFWVFFFGDGLEGTSGFSKRTVSLWTHREHSPVFRSIGHPAGEGQTISLRSVGGRTNHNIKIIITTTLFILPSCSHLFFMRLDSLGLPNFGQRSPRKEKSDFFGF